MWAAILKFSSTGRGQQQQQQQQRKRSLTRNSVSWSQLLNSAFRERCRIKMAAHSIGSETHGVSETDDKDHSGLIRTGSGPIPHSLLVLTNPKSWPSETRQIRSPSYFCPFQIANHTGYITVDWKRVEQDMNKAKKQLKLNAENPTKEVKTKVQEVTVWGLIVMVLISCELGSYSYSFPSIIKLTSVN